LAIVAKPKLHEVIKAPDMEAGVPRAFGMWRELQTPFVPVGLVTNTETTTDQPYDQVVMRSYVDTQGHVIHVALAWGKHQRQEVKIHRPELCYPAQGFQVQRLLPVRFPITSPQGQTITGKRMMTRDRAGRTEAVSYWIRLGSSYSDSPWETRLHILKEGLAGRVTDGMLVRVSTRLEAGQDPQEAFARQEQFAAQLVTASPLQVRTMMVR
jgi:EpsI family protein